MTQVEVTTDLTKTPTGDDTMHLVHVHCMLIAGSDAEVIALCGTRTRWIDGDALKCPICMEMGSQPVPCPMCGEMTVPVP